MYIEEIIIKPGKTDENKNLVFCMFCSDKSAVCTRSYRTDFGVSEFVLALEELRVERHNLSLIHSDSTLLSIVCLVKRRHLLLQHLCIEADLE